MTDIYHKRFVCLQNWGFVEKDRVTKGKIYDFHHYAGSRWQTKGDSGKTVSLSVTSHVIWGDIFREIPSTEELENK